MSIGLKALLAMTFVDSRNVMEDPQALVAALKRVRDAGMPLPDLVVAGKLLSIPSRFSLQNGVKKNEGVRPFINFAGNEPICAWGDRVFGTGMMHLMSTIDDITLGQVPYYELMLAELEGIPCAIWSPPDPAEPRPTDPATPK